MARDWVRALAAAGSALAFACIALYLGQPPGPVVRPDLKPTAHWIFDGEGVAGNRVIDRVGRLHGTLLGTPKLASDHPTHRLEFTTPSDGILLKDRVPPDAEFLPKDALSLVAWVRVDEPTEWGGIIGCMQDNGLNELGFILGYNGPVSTFGLATQKTKKLTYLTSQTKYERGKWYHVAGVYDGKQMRLYVNGRARRRRAANNRGRSCTRRPLRS